MKFDIMGPKGKWKIKKIKGVKNLSAMTGEFPDSITAEEIKGESTDIVLELEYNGETITTPTGNSIAERETFFFFV